VTGYTQAHSESEIVVDQSLIVRGDFQYESGYRAAAQLFSRDEPPTAIFACNDLMAVGALSNALEAGYHIPDDLSVIGFDDVRPALYANPPLTTVSQPKYEMGVVATELLFHRMQEPDRPTRSHTLETTLVIRQSTARNSKG
jgi:DNA-binding LacI/PurR family transcriptional regulator